MDDRTHSFFKQKAHTHDPKSRVSLEATRMILERAFRLLFAALTFACLQYL